MEMFPSVPILTLGSNISIAGSFSVDKFPIVGSNKVLRRFNHNQNWYRDIVISGGLTGNG